MAKLLYAKWGLYGYPVFELQNDYGGTTGETFPIKFNLLSANNPNWSVSIRPAARAIARTTSGDPGTSNPLILLNGADRIIFDERPGGSIAQCKLCKYTKCRPAFSCRFYR
jgi:hypothetical protein